MKDLKFKEEQKSLKILKKGKILKRELSIK